ncbi:4-hydroxy-tetrahydrodipicolinate synthase [Candidatus Pseudothioglobus singularis]|uniref:4-hydroxy-tetrahydrodipicolinate synthase n=1 Tax=Candidatus Pseudothioglobus singularis PS1 TaxID=1125411 RepID=A0A0M5KRM7_9GAMM|nr:4-hydroxy-tetrahydrodipicolinate synthase [Candidatus Pseudothioglobus singularis]ALE01503.1 dihydrodipicolinate synthase [Candidatus Pseudothioglobus singularis PS1]
MNKNHSFVGSNVALITPMLDDGSVDYESLNNLIEFHIDAGTSSIVSVGTTGESATVGVKEHLKILDHTIKYAARRIPIIAGTGANSTSEAIELTQEAKNFGADACLLVTPYYNKPTQEGLFQHFKLIAESVSIDQILYNVPGRTAVDMSVDTTSRLSEISNIIGIKDATGDLSVIKELVANCPEDFLLLTGDDATAIDFLLLGGHGGISVTANVTPNELQKAYLAAIAGNVELANQLNEALSGLHKNLFIESNPIPVKWALHKMGKCDNGIRLPLLELSNECKTVLENDLKELKLI